MEDFKANARSNVVAKILKEREKRPGQLDSETKAQFFWRKLRESIRNTVREVTKSDAKEVEVIHGVHHLRKINHTNKLQHVFFNSETQEYLTIDCNGINLFYADGRGKDCIVPEEPVNHIIYAKEVNRYVGWETGGLYVRNFASDFELISEAKSPFKIFCGLYNQWQTEFITAGEGHVMCWNFRYGAKHLIYRKIAKQDLTAQDRFTLLALEDTASRAQRCFAVCNTGVAVFNLFEGALQSYKKDLHARAISSLLFFNPLKYLITAALDGSIKVWDENWHLQLVFVGHGTVVTALAVYPYGPNIISASEDCTLRVWSLETCDEVDLIKTDEPVVGLGSILKNDCLYSYSEQTVDLWKLRHLHTLYTTTGSKVDRIKVTSQPQVARKVVCICRDSTVRIVTPGSGDVITSFIAAKQNGISDAVLAAANGTMFVNLTNGAVIKTDTSTNPCTIQAVWNPHGKKKGEFLNCICLYEYAIESKMREDTWKGILKTLTASNMASPTNQLKSVDQTLLIGGRKDGYIAVLDWESMKVRFKIDAHGSGGVLGLVANPENDQLISAGLDNVIKVWRVFPFAEEALAPLMSFYCSHLPHHMTVMKSTLCVAFQDNSSATFSIVHYNLNNKSRFDHSPDDDHIDAITGICCCPRMKLFASSSLDTTIRIWDERNRLIRIVRLNAEPLSINFFSERADLMIGIGKHLHRMDHSAYLPRNYLFKMVSMAFPAIPTEPVIPYDEAVVQTLNPTDKKRLKSAHSSLFRFESFVDKLTEEESEEIVKEKEEKEKAYSVLAAREIELKKIRDGELSSKRKPAPPPGTKERAFHRYWQMIHNEKHVEKISEEDDFTPEPIKKRAQPEPKWDSEFEPAGFFPHHSVCKPVVPESNDDGSESPAKRETPYPIHPMGFIPNSVLVRLLWPPEVTQKAAEDRYKPPALTDEQLAEIAGKKRTPKEEPVTPDEEPEKSTTRSSFLDQFDFDITKSTTPKDLDEELEYTPPPTPPVAPSPQPIAESPKTPTKPREIKPLKKIEKLVPPKPRTPSPPPLPTPSPPRPPTPLPSFITQFKGSEWFEQYFPNANVNSFPKPWTIVNFVTMLLKLVKIADYGMKNRITEAISLLNQQEQLSNSRAVYETIISTLNKGNGPSCTDEEQKMFIMNSLKLLSAMCIYEKDFLIEAMVQFLDGDREVRELVHDMLILIGLQDTHNYFFRELDSWDVWNLEEENRKKDLTAMCKLWVDKWTTLFKNHLKKTLENLKKGKVSGKIQRRPGGRTSGGSSGSRPTPSDSPTKSILKKGEKADGSSPHSLDLGMKGSYSPGESPDEAARPLTVTFDMAPGDTAINSIEPIEVVNYFVEMELEKHLEQLRQQQYAAQAAQKTDGNKNTILVLPKIRSGSGLSLTQQREDFDSSAVNIEERENFENLGGVQIGRTPSAEQKTSRDLFEELQRQRQSKKTKVKLERNMRKRQQRERVNRPTMFYDGDSKPSLVRLGETHTSKCRPKRETALTVDLRLPPINSCLRKAQPDGLYNFTNRIDLPMKTLYMNPFPSPIDIYDQTHQPILLMLKTSQKYFVPSQSLVSNESTKQ
ncbi:WD repeat-containing protein 97-like isoform X2 [Anneissia japonica]|uniref:WD repeat-containing protein 97-like isoform X2 n=1 Tax=Anneissia japonica TaxID=1529436 RepID=UPI0014256785|nr:WD repeat-containing protein 97-like isoform X2 [Anneissia japonica]